MKKNYLLFLIFAVSCINLFAQQPSTPASTPPVRPPANVISIYSGAYANVPGTNYNPFWGQAGFAAATEITVLGDAIRSYPSMNYQGVEFGSGQNVSSLDSLHLDIWSSNCTSIEIYLVAGGSGERQVTRTLTTNAWNSINIKLTDYSSQTSFPLNNIIQFKFVSLAPASGANVFIDNMYFFTNVNLPTITGFSIPAKMLGDAPFAITTPTSNSAGAFTYSSSNTSVATISGSMVTIVGAGNSIITATQAASGIYSSGTATTNLVVGFNPPTVAAPTPTIASTSVISMFSNAYTNRTIDTWSASWDAADVMDTTIAGNSAKKYSNLNFAGIEFLGPNSINATAMNFLHVDIWTPNTSPIKIKLVDFGADNVFTGSDNSESIEYQLTPTLNLGAWTSYDIPLSAFTGLASRANLSQMVIVGSNATFFLDNVYFTTVTLPVSLLNFSATKNGNAVTVNWKTATEINNKGFAVERSNNANNWAELTFVNGNGNSSTVKNYTVTDNSPLKGINYYRLKQVDNDGKVTYSSTVAVKFSDAQSTGFTFYPNPVKNKLTVMLDKIETNNANLNLVAIDGKIVRSIALKNTNSNSSFLLDVNGLTNGVYNLVLTDGTTVKTNKVIIENR